MSDEITIDLASLHSAAKKICLPEQTIHKIMGLAVTRTARWAARYLRSELGKATKIGGKIIKGRMRVSIDSEHGAANIWLGLNPIGLEHFNAIQTPSGVESDVKAVPHGFINTGNRGKGLVFLRLTKDRKPIEKQTFEPEQAGMTAFQKTVAKISEKLSSNFERAYLDVVGNAL